jgi:hypothetical protein
MNKSNYYRRNFIKGVLALVGTVFTWQLVRFGSSSAASEESCVRISKLSRERHRLEGVSVELRNAMFGTGRKLG